MRRRRGGRRRRRGRRAPRHEPPRGPLRPRRRTTEHEIERRFDDLGERLAAGIQEQVADRLERAFAKLESLPSRDSGRGRGRRGPRRALGVARGEDPARGWTPRSSPRARRRRRRRPRPATRSGRAAGPRRRPRAASGSRAGEGRRRCGCAPSSPRSRDATRSSSPAHLPRAAGAPRPGGRQLCNRLRRGVDRVPVPKDVERDRRLPFPVHGDRGHGHELPPAQRPDVHPGARHRPALAGQARARAAWVANDVAALAHPVQDVPARLPDRLAGRDARSGARPRGSRRSR